jgi:hypothetical protein
MVAANRTAALPLQLGAKKLKSLRDGGHSSMVEPQIVVLAVAGSSPVGHPEPSLERTAQAGSVRPTRQAIREPFLNTTSDAMRVVMIFVDDLAQGSLRELDIPPILPDSGNHFNAIGVEIPPPTPYVFGHLLGWRNSVSHRFSSRICACSSTG